MPASVVAASTLREALASAFSLAELKIALADLGVNPERVPQYDGGIELWALEIVAYFQRRGRLDELIAYCAKERPDIPWQQLAEAHRQALARLSSAEHTADDAFHDIQRGIGALEKLSRDPNARPLILRIRDDLQEAGDHIMRLSNYKHLHDEFQELQVRYSVIERDCHSAETDDTAWNTLAEYLTQWDGIMSRLLAIAAQPGLAPSDVAWAARLAQIQRNVRDALETQTVAPLANILPMMRRLLEREPSLVNAKIFEVVRGMLQRSVIPPLIELREALAQRRVDGASLDEFARGIESLQGLRDRLQMLVTEHDRWQQMEDELNPILGNLSRSPDVLAQSWPFVSSLAHEMLDGVQEDWAVAILVLDARIRERLAANDAPRARPLVYQFHSRVSNRFRIVDDDLLKVVVELQKIGDSLQRFLRGIL
ncbi:MAG: hypothetical protein KatS3mg053_3836 [Candidatus Roseilinea sp.]|nr:MAG: hypothetical protein KatS3mg053_3836 [Candidatus Roseilinea sp.]